MIFYIAYFDGFNPEQVILSVMATEEYRLANGGKSNLDLILEKIKKDFPNRKLTKLVRTTTGQVVWEASI